MGEEYIDSAIQQVLSSSRLKLAHPGNAKLTEVYPTPSSVTSILAQAINHRGQFRVAPNNRLFGARSDFILSSSALISEIAIAGSFTVENTGGPAAQLKLNAVGYGFDLIESIEITFSNSLMQNMFIRGETLKDYSLLCCTSDRERWDMLKSAGQQFGNSFAAPVTYKFVVPISFLNFTTASLRNSWPVDGSVLAGPIQVSINWRQSFYALVATSTPLAPYPASFASLELVCKTTQLQDASFSVKKAMMLDPELVYSLPSRYITTVDYSKAGQPGVAMTINLASAPSGMLEGIIVSIAPDDGATAWSPPLSTGDRNYRGGSCTLDEIQLEFGGQNIYYAKSYEEHLHYMRNCFGDNMEWPGAYYENSQSNPVDTDGQNTEMYAHPIYFIPLINDGYGVIREHVNENVPSYGGSQLQLRLIPSNEQRIQLKGIATTAQSAAWGSMQDVRLQGAVTHYKIMVGYIVSSLVEISQGTVDLQL